MAYKVSHWDSMRDGRARLRDARAFTWWGAFVVAFTLTLVVLASTQADSLTRYVRFTTEGKARVHVVEIRRQCLTEDSLGHLRVKDLDSDSVRLGCKVHGY